MNNAQNPQANNSAAQSEDSNRVPPDAIEPKDTVPCYDSNGSGTYKDEECNLCAGTGRVHS